MAPRGSSRYAGVGRNCRAAIHPAHVALLHVVLSSVNVGIKVGGPSLSSQLLKPQLLCRPPASSNSSAFGPWSLVSAVATLSFIRSIRPENAEYRSTVQCHHLLSQPACTLAESLPPSVQIAGGSISAPRCQHRQFLPRGAARCSTRRGLPMAACSAPSDVPVDTCGLLLLAKRARRGADATRHNAGGQTRPRRWQCRGHKHLPSPARGALAGVGAGPSASGRGGAGRGTAASA